VRIDEKNLNKIFIGLNLCLIKEVPIIMIVLARFMEIKEVLFKLCNLICSDQINPIQDLFDTICGDQINPIQDFFDTICGDQINPIQDFFDTICDDQINPIQDCFDMLCGDQRSSNYKF